MNVRTFHGISELSAAVGTHLGYSAWRTVPQEQIEAYADLIGDRQWIHVDPVRAATGPFGGTVAHGYLTLSLVPTLLDEIFVIRDVQMAVNYGTDRLRFPAPVLAGSRIRAGVELLDLRPVPAGQQLTADVVIERESGGKPAMILQLLILVVP